MSLYIEMKNFFAFLNRRKWVILATMLIVGVAMMFATPSKKTVAPVVNETPKEYGTDIQMIIEDKSTSETIINLAILKYSLISDEVIDLLKKEDIDITKDQLEKNIDLFIRNGIGDALFLRIHGTDKEMIEKLVNFYYDAIVNDKIPYYSTKNVYIITKPNMDLNQLKYFNDLYTTTSQSIRPPAVAKEAEAESKFNSRNGIIGALIGLFIGTLLGIYLDSRNKKILTKNYLIPLIDDEKEIINNGATTPEIIAAQLYFDIINNKSKNILIVSQFDTIILDLLHEKLGEYETQIIFTSDLQKQNITALDTCFMIVSAKQTEKAWFTEQYQIIHSVMPSLKIVFSK